MRVVAQLGALARASWIHLRLGARLVCGLPVSAADFRASFESVVLLVAGALAVAAGVGYYGGGYTPYFDDYGTPLLGCVLLAVTVYLLAIARLRGAQPAMVLATMLAAAAPYLLAVVYAVAERNVYALDAALLWGVLIVVRALRLVFPGRALPLIAVTLLLAAGAAALPWDLIGAPRFYYGDEESYDDAYLDLHDEDIYYSQPALVQAATSALLPQRPGVADLYFVGFAGDGDVGVFWREAQYARAVFDRRFGTAGRSLVLANRAEDIEQRPLATRHNLALVLQQVGARMDPDEDALFLFLTSHGSDDATLAVSLYPLDLVQLTAEDLRAALDAAGIRWRIIVISACYAGSFIDALRDEHTAVLTAAAADRSSFGCADERKLTYFGEALLRDGFAATPDLLGAFEVARTRVSERETAEGLEPSNPQIIVGRAMRRRLEALAAHGGGIW